MSTFRTSTPGEHWGPAVLTSSLESLEQGAPCLFTLVFPAPAGGRTKAIEFLVYRDSQEKRVHMAQDPGRTALYLPVNITWCPNGSSERGGVRRRLPEALTSQWVMAAGMVTWWEGGGHSRV